MSSKELVFTCSLFIFLFFSHGEHRALLALFMHLLVSVPWFFFGKLPFPSLGPCGMTGPTLLSPRPAPLPCFSSLVRAFGSGVLLRRAQKSPEIQPVLLGKGHDLLSGYLNLAWCKPRMQGPWWRRSLPKKRPTGRGRESAGDPIGGHDLPIIYLHVTRLHFKEAVSSLFMLNDFPFGLLISLFIQKIFSKYLAYVQGTIVSAGDIGVSKTKSCPCEIDSTHTYQWTNRVPKMKTQIEKPGR